MSLPRAVCAKTKVGIACKRQNRALLERRMLDLYMDWQSVVIPVDDRVANELVSNQDPRSFAILCDGSPASDVEKKWQ